MKVDRPPVKLPSWDTSQRRSITRPEEREAHPTLPAVRGSALPLPPRRSGVWGHGRRAVIYRDAVTRSALVVLVPAAEPVVATLRCSHDPMSGRGVPAHVTVLHPFRSVVDEETAAAVERLASSMDAFTATLARAGWFPGSVVFLEPEPVQRFKDLTAATVEAFPDCPPYGGAFADPHPHLTVGNRVDEPTAQRIESILSPSLPIDFRVDRLTLLVEDDDGQWTVDRSWPLRVRS